MDSCTAKSGTFSFKLYRIELRIKYFSVFIAALRGNNIVTRITFIVIIIKFHKLGLRGFETLNSNFLQNIKENIYLLWVLMNYLSLVFLDLDF